MSPSTFTADSKPIQSNRADVATIKGIISNPQTGIKAEKLNWSGVIPWLERQTGPITKQAELDYLAADGSVRLEEVASGAMKSAERRSSRAISRWNWDHGSL